jgi:DedD protein
VLEHEPRDSEQEIAIHIPSPDSTTLKPRPISPQEPSAEKPRVETPKPPAADLNRSGEDALRAEQDKILAAPERPVTRERTASVAEGKKKGEPAEAKKAEPAETKKAESAGQFVVQIAALADADKASGIQSQLAAKGLKVYTEKVHTAAGEVTRVRVGPFPNREAAEKERARLRGLGFEGNVAPR